tara:strand:+ start:85 stop:657 length:573 start_codon:yes stop_codon:yes gene_type:complete
MSSYFTRALEALKPNSEWAVTGDQYSRLTWLDESQTKPTEQEIEVKIAELKYQEEVNVYQEKRKLEYPDWGDQLDQIYHNGIDIWKADIKAIKDKYPKQTTDATELQKRKDAAVFNLQKKNYLKAKTRLAQYELSAGVKDENGNYTVYPLPVYVHGIGRNPLIVQDEKEREASQRVVNETPQAVIDSINT